MLRIAGGLRLMMAPPPRNGSMYTSCAGMAATIAWLRPGVPLEPYHDAIGACSPGRIARGRASRLRSVMPNAQSSADRRRPAHEDDRGRMPDPNAVRQQDQWLTRGVSRYIFN